MKSLSARVYFFLFAALLFVSAVAALCSATELPVSGVVVSSLSVTGFAYVGLDKSLARSRSARIPELILFTIALLGGSPGVFLGVHFFKHKTKKAYFQFILLLIFCVQLCFALLLDISLLTELRGAVNLRSLRVEV